MLRLVRYLKPFTLPFLVMTVLLFGQTAANLALPDYLARIVNVGIVGQNPDVVSSTGRAMLLVALLYWSTPNVKQPKFRWISVGAAVAILVWVAASVGFGFYVANFSSYDKTYGTLAGLVVLLLWFWITNLAILFGHQMNAERERSTEIEEGLPRAEKEIQLEPRDEPKDQKTT